MFLGEYKHVIDDKGRMTIPSKYRDALKEGLVLTRGFDQNLVLYTMDGWSDLAKRITERSLSDPRVRDFRRRVFSAAADFVPDRQGRILVPPSLRQFAQIEGEVIIAGMYDYIEIWSSTQWQQRRDHIENPEDSSYWSDLGF